MPQLPRLRPNPLQIAWRYARDPWWFALLAILGIIALFVDRALPFDSIRQRPPLGPLIHLGSGVEWKHLHWLQWPIAERPLWCYLALLVYFYLGTFLTDFVINRLCSTLARIAKLSERLHDLIGMRLRDRRLLVLSRWIGRMAVVLWGALWIGVTPPFANACIAFFKASIGFYFTWWTVQLIHAFVERWRHSTEDPNSHETKQIFHIIDTAARITVLMVMSLMVANNLGLNINSILAPASLLGVAIGVGAQELAANLIGAVTLFLDRPFRVGDRVRVDSLEATVENIGLRSTRFWNSEGCLVTLPNSAITKATVTNLDKAAPKA